MDSSGVLAALSESEGFIHAFNDGNALGELNQIAFNAMTGAFGQFVDERAVMSSQADPRGLGEFHHLYETGMVGRTSARLFNFSIPGESRKRGASELYGRFTFIEATEPGWAFGKTEIESDAQVYNDNVPAFRRKAEVFEMGEPIRPKIGTRFYVRPKPNYMNEVGSLPYVVNQISLRTTEFETYHRLHEEFAWFVASGAGRGVLTDRLNTVQRVVIPELQRRLQKRIAEHNIKFSKGAGTGRDVNYRVFQKNVASRVTEEYANLLRERLDAMSSRTAAEAV